MDKDPLTYSLITYGWVLGLAIWGGLVNFYHKSKKGMVRAWNVTEFIGEIATSALSGIITFYLCEIAQTPQLLSAVFIAVSGHMGSRLIFLLEKRLENKINRFGDNE